MQTLTRRSSVEPKLSVLTYNVALLRLNLLPGLIETIEPNRHVQRRFAHLPNVLRRISADIVCLQEVFDPLLRKQLIVELRDVYPYHAADTNTRRFLGVGTGLLIMSRFPLSAPEFVPFTHNCLDDRLTVVRGVLWAMAALPSGREVAVLTTHLVAGGLFRHPESRPMDDVRFGQIDTVHQERKRIMRTHKIPVIMTGDFNCGPQASRGNYEALSISGLCDVYGRVGEDPHAVTWDPYQPLNANLLHKNCVPQRIDHVLVDANEIDCVSAAIVGTELLVDLKQKAHPHVSVSDHYGVYSQLALS